MEIWRRLTAPMGYELENGNVGKGKSGKTRAKFKDASWKLEFFFFV